MRLGVRSAGALVAVVALSGCGMVDGRSDGPAMAKAPAAGPSFDDGNYKLGTPYEVAGETYNPADAAQYDEVGYASWYGDELGGRPTANGEQFNPRGVSAAHPTLPMPSYVEVTHLGTGKTILVRVNDRGPFKKNRMIDLSHGAAEQLGVTGDGNFPVRVRRVNPPDSEKAALRAGMAVPERLETPAPLLSALRKKLGAGPITPAASPTPPPPRPRAAPVPRAAAGATYSAPPPRSEFIEEDAGVSRRRAPLATGKYYIQVAAFSSRANAQAAARAVGGQVVASGNVFRVRKGPYASDVSARAALGGVAAKGYRDARIVR